MEDANIKAIQGIGGAIVIGCVATAILYFTQETNNYVVKINGTRMTQEAYDQMASSAKANPMAMMQGEERLKQMIVSSMVDRELVTEEATKRGLTMSDKDLQAKVADLQKPYGDDDHFKKVLDANHMTLPDLKDRIRYGYMAEELGKDLTKNDTITDVEAQKYYDTHQAMYRTDQEVRASHILVKDEAKAKALLKQLQGGADFATLAKANSLDGSKTAGGDLGFFGRGKMVPEFENAAFALKPGQLSGVVKTQFGYHIIKVTDVHPATNKPFAQVKGQVKEADTKDKQRQALEKWLEDARKTATIVYKPGYEPPATPSPAAPKGAPGASGAAAPAMGSHTIPSPAAADDAPHAAAPTPIPTEAASSPAGDQSVKGHAPSAAPAATGAKK